MVAVAFLHGVETDDADYAVTASTRLRALFDRHGAARGLRAREHLTIHAIYWADVVQTPERLLLHAVMGESSETYFRWMRWLAGLLNAGYQSALVPAALAALARNVPGLGGLNYPTLRWLLTDFLGDAVAYQTTGREHRLHDAIHLAVAGGLERLATTAGPEAPLCLIAHSLGTVIASNFIWDLQQERQGRRLMTATLRRVTMKTPLQRGETLTHLYTLGSPLALWAMRHGGFGTPVTVPDPALCSHHPGLDGGWDNFFEKDDVIAYPLRVLGEQYARAVRADHAVRLGGWLASWNPLVHPFYWNDDRVLDPIARALVRTAVQMRCEPEPSTIQTETA